MGNTSGASSDGDAQKRDSAVQVEVGNEKRVLPTEPSAGHEPDDTLDTPTLLAAVQGFADAYHQLIMRLNRESKGIFRKTADALREAVYTPVPLENGEEHERARRISLYEIGISRSPNYREAGRLTVDEKKFQAALEMRLPDVRVLFTKESDGLLVRLSGIVGNFLKHPASENVREHGAALLIQCGGLYELFLSN